MERGASISKTLLAGAQSTEVLGSLGDNIFVEDEVDATALLCWRIDVSSVTQLRGCLPCVKRGINKSGVGAGRAIGSWRSITGDGIDDAFDAPGRWGQ